MRRSLTIQWLVASIICWVFVIGGFIVLTSAVQGLRSAGRAAVAAQQILSSADFLEIDVLSLEAGVRGYLISPQSKFLQPYNDALSSFPKLSAQLESQVSSNPAEHVKVVTIVKNVDSYVNDWATGLLALARRSIPAARKLAATGGGNQRIATIRSEFSSLATSESAIASQQIYRANSRGELGFILGQVALGVFAMAFLIISLILRRKIVLPVRKLRDVAARLERGELAIRADFNATAEVGELVASFNLMAESLERQRDTLEAQNVELAAQQSDLTRVFDEVELERKYAELMRSFGDDLANTDRLEELLGKVLAGLAQRANADFGAIYVLDRNGQTYQLAANRGFNNDSLPQLLVPGSGLAGRAITERDLVEVTLDSVDTEFLALSGVGRPKRELHFPLILRDRVLGVVSLGLLSEQPVPSEVISTLLTMSDRAAVSIAEAVIRRDRRSAAREIELILASTDEGIYGIGSDGIVTFANSAALEQIGFTRDEFVGKDAHQLIHHSYPGGSPYPTSECPIWRSKRDGKGERVSNEVFWRADGSSFPVEYSSYPLLDGGVSNGAVVTFIDISDRVEMERQRDVQQVISSSLAEAEDVESSLPVLLGVICRGFGWDAGISWRINGRSASLEVTATYENPEGDGVLERYLALPSERRTAATEAAGTSTIIVRTDTRSLAPIRSEDQGNKTTRNVIAIPIVGSHKNVIGVAEFLASNYSLKKGLHETLRSIGSQVAQFIERKRVEAGIVREKDEFVATVSHELRTPLTAINGWIHIILGGEPGPLTPEQLHALTVVRRNSDRLMNLVEDLLLVGRIDAGQFELELTRIDLAELVRETAELLSLSFSEKSIKITVSIESSGDVLGDRTRLVQLFTNILGNAIKFTPPLGEVRIFVHRDAHNMVAEISDTGIGIPEDEQSRLFQRFFRASSATEHGVVGTGLGLSISAAIAERHGGSITLGAHEGSGTTFVVTIPLAGNEIGER